MNPADITSLNALGLLVLLGAGCFTLVLPRRYALLPIIVVTCFMTLGQMVVVAGLHFTMMRIVVLFGWVRLLVRHEIRPLRLNAIDKAVLAWTVVAIVTHSLLWQTSDEFINRLGFGYNVLGMYFLFRFLVRDIEDIKRLFEMMAIVVVPLAAAMLIERETERNVFAIFGGVRAVTELRGGTLRCQGPFGHPILAGTFGACLLPFFLSLWWQGRKYKWLAIAGVVSSTTIVITAGSSGPVMAFLAGTFAMALWLFRKYMRLFRWGALIGFCGFAVVMKAPVWYLIQRVNIFSGSNGDHRALLIDEFVRHFWEWWLLGTKSTVQWADENMWDITNQFVWEGVNGGLLTLLLFALIIVLSFQAVERAARASQAVPARNYSLLVWSLGAAMFAHCASFLSITYFDQNVVNWYLLLALCSTVLATRIKKTSSVPMLQRTTPLDLALAKPRNLFS